MIVAILKETLAGERRVGVTPDTVRQLARAGFELAVEAGAGTAAGFPDATYEKAGARVVADRAALLAGAHIVVKVQPPSDEEIGQLGEGSALICLLRPLDEPALATRLAARKVDAFSLELMPRITRAQSMDVLSSQSNLAGYRAVLLAAVEVPQIFPMLVTAAGTISPARALIIGAGVAGLQAIATARRLGAVVEAYDTRPVVKEQVESLGAKFVELDLDTGDAEDAGGYAKAQSEEFLARQRELLGQRVQAADIVITTALVPGQRAPLLIEESVVQGMKPGSVIVDLAAANGGNCALTRADEKVHAHGVTVLGPTNLPSDVARDASQMFAKNVATFLQHLAEEGTLRIDREDPITAGTLVTYQGAVVHDAVLSRLPGAGGS